MNINRQLTDNLLLTLFTHRWTQEVKICKEKDLKREISKVSIFQHENVLALDSLKL